MTTLAGIWLLLGLLFLGGLALISWAATHAVDCLNGEHEWVFPPTEGMAYCKRCGLSR